MRSLIERPPQRQFTPHAGGILVPVCERGRWPRTCLAALPTSTRTSHDTDGDATVDVVLTTHIKLVDRNADGVADAVLLRVTAGEAIQNDTPLTCGPAERAAALQLVIESL